MPRPKRSNSTTGGDVTTKCHPEKVSFSPPNNIVMESKRRQPAKRKRTKAADYDDYSDDGEEHLIVDEDSPYTNGESSEEGYEGGDGITEDTYGNDDAAYDDEYGEDEAYGIHVEYDDGSDTLSDDDDIHDDIDDDDDAVINRDERDEYVTDEEAEEDDGDADNDDVIEGDNTESETNHQKQGNQRDDRDEKTSFIIPGTTTSGIVHGQYVGDNDTGMASIKSKRQSSTAIEGSNSRRNPTAVAVTKRTSAATTAKHTKRPVVPRVPGKRKPRAPTVPGSRRRRKPTDEPQIGPDGLPMPPKRKREPSTVIAIVRRMGNITVQPPTCKASHVMAAMTRHVNHTDYEQVLHPRWSD